MKVRLKFDGVCGCQVEHLQKGLQHQVAVWLQQERQGHTVALLACAPEMQYWMAAL